MLVCAAGVTSDIAGVRKAMDAVSHPALLLVDGVSSIGALDFKAGPTALVCSSIGLHVMVH